MRNLANDVGTAFRTWLDEPRRGRQLTCVPCSAPDRVLAGNPRYRSAISWVPPLPTALYHQQARSYLVMAAASPRMRSPSRMPGASAPTHSGERSIRSPETGSSPPSPAIDGKTGVRRRRYDASVVRGPFYHQRLLAGSDLRPPYIERGLALSSWPCLTSACPHWDCKRWALMWLEWTSVNSPARTCQAPLEGGATQRRDPGDGWLPEAGSPTVCPSIYAAWRAAP